MRVFSGIPLSGRGFFKLNLVLQELSAKNNEFRWVPPENLHITFHFFGERNLEEVEIIQKVMLEKLKNVRVSMVKITNADAFPHKQKPRVVYFNLEDGGFLQKTYQNISSGLKEHNLTFTERPFVPHITLGRLAGKYKAGKMPQIEPLNEMLEIKQVNLYQSILKTTGAVYTVLREFPLINM